MSVSNTTRSRGYLPAGIKGSGGRAFVGIAAAVLLMWTAAAAGDNIVFATVNGTEILRQDFDREVYSAARNSYYHGQPPGDAEYLQLRREVADRLIDRAVLIDRAKHYRITADMDIVTSEISKYEERYGHTARWKTERAVLIEALRTRLMEDDVVRQVENRIRAGEPPDDSALRSYYQSNLDKFTQPKRDRVSLILVAVDPSTGAETWDEARRKAAELLARIRGGADFAELARSSSDDRTAENGGDMGYLHEGMLSPDAEEALHALSVGETSEPVTVLEGISIFRLDERHPPELQKFDAVKGRVADLWLRDDEERRLQSELAALRADSSIEIDMEYLSQAARQ